MTTVVEASKCPRCKSQGEIRKGGGVKSGERKRIDNEWWDVVVYYCLNDVCPWFNTGWLVSSNERGEVFERQQGARGHDRTFERMSPDALARGRRMVEDLKNMDLRDDEK